MIHQQCQRGHSRGKGIYEKRYVRRSFTAFPTVRRLQQSVKMNIFGIGGVLTFKNAKKLRSSCHSAAVPDRSGNGLPLHGTKYPMEPGNFLFESALCAEAPAHQGNYCRRSNCSDGKRSEAVIIQSINFDRTRRQVVQSRTFIFQEKKRRETAREDRICCIQAEKLPAEAFF